MIVLDVTIVKVALPSTQEDLGFAQNDLAWVVNAYLISFGALLLLAGRIGDLIWPAAHLPHWPRSIQRRIARVWIGSEPGHAGRGSLRIGHRRRAYRRCHPGHVERLGVDVTPSDPRATARAGRAIGQLPTAAHSPSRCRRVTGESG